MPMVDIRQYYVTNDVYQASKKGVSLPAEQWQNLADGFDALAAAVKSKQ